MNAYHAPGLAFFDFDGTICRGDSILPFLLFCIRRGLAPKRQLLKAAHGYLVQLRHPERVSWAKSRTLSFLDGKRCEAVDSLSREFLASYVPSHLLSSAGEELSRLHRDGWRIVAVSASPSVYLSLLPEFLPIDEVLCTPCMAADGVYTGKVGVNCRSDEKPRRISAWLESNGMQLSAQPVRAYGDSRGDLPMLQLADQPFLINASKELSSCCPKASVLRWQ